MAELARRLGRRWELPPWLTAVIGYLDLPAPIAPTFGGDPVLATIVQAAIALTARAGTNPFAMAIGTPLDEAVARLGLSMESVSCLGAGTSPAGEPIDNPYKAPLLRDLLELAAENAGRRELHLVPRLEAEVDHLHRLLLDQPPAKPSGCAAKSFPPSPSSPPGPGTRSTTPWRSFLAKRSIYSISKPTRNGSDRCGPSFSRLSVSIKSSPI